MVPKKTRNLWSCCSITAGLIMNSFLFNLTRFYLLHIKEFDKIKATNRVNFQYIYLFVTRFTNFLRNESQVNK